MDGVASGETADADVTGWSSSDTDIATVSGGTVTGVAAGTATITVTDSSCETGYTTADASVTVTTAPPTITWRMKSLSISPSTIQVGGSTTSYSAIKEKYVNGEASGETADADVTGWSSDDTSIATVSGGTVTGVAAGTATITATDSSCETGYTTADATVTVTTAPIVDAFDHYEYENVNVEIWSTVSNNFPVGGTSYTIKATASATRYEVWTVSGKKATGETVTTTPHISGGGGAFTSIDEDSSSVDCSVGANTGAERSADYTATATFGEDPYAKSGSASCTVIQDAYVKPDDFEWIDTSINLEAGEGQVTANFKSTSNDPSIVPPSGIQYSLTISSTPDSEGYYSGTARFSASASCADGYSGTITGTAGSDSDDLSFDVFVMYTLESASLKLEKTQGGKDYYYVELTYHQSGGAKHTANVTDSFSVGGSRGFSVSIAWDVEEDRGHGLEWFSSTNVVTSGHKIQASLTVDGNLSDASNFDYLLQS